MSFDSDVPVRRAGACYLLRQLLDRRFPLTRPAVVAPIPSSRKAVRIMRQAKQSATAIGIVLLASVVLAIGGLLLDGQSTAQVVVDPAPAQPRPAGPQALPPTPVVDVPNLMQLFNKPLYMGLKEKMSQQFKMKLMPGMQEGAAEKVDGALRKAINGTPETK